jgi:hypothetical protein
MAMKFKLPKSWNDVTVPQLIQLEEIRTDKSIDEQISPSLVRSYLILSLFTGMPYDYFESMKISEAKKLIEKIAFINSYPPDNIVNYFWCGGYRWKVNINLNNLTGGNLIDHYELTRDQDKILINCNKILAMYCEPLSLMFFKKEMSYEKKCEILLKAPVQVVYPLTVFFCRLYPQLLEVTKDYLIKAEKEMKELIELTN